LTWFPLSGTNTQDDDTEEDGWKNR
jgi:hypothetical protein